MATAKKAVAPEAEPLDEDDLLPEYDLDYSKGRSNRYAGQIDWSQDVILLDDETAPGAGSILALDNRDEYPEVTRTDPGPGDVSRRAQRTNAATPRHGPRTHAVTQMRIVEVHPQPNYILTVVADDGRVGRFDVSPYLKYEAFEDLRRPGEFARVINGGYFVEWACGADLSADTIEARWQVVEDTVGELAPA